MQEIYGILTQGGPLGIAAIMWAMWMMERKERVRTQDKLLEVSNAMIENAAKTESAISDFSKLLERLLDKMD